MLNVQKTIAKLERIGNDFGVRINVKKTKLMVVKGKGRQTRVKINGKTVEEVDSLKYLGSIINMKLGYDEEIWIKCGLARNTKNSTNCFYTRP